MRFLKVALVLTTFALLFNACEGNSNSNQTTNSNARQTNSNAQTPSNTATATPTPDQFASIRGTFEQFCQRCHKADGTGGEFDLDGEMINVPNLREHGLRDSDSSLERHILNGGKKMPPFRNRLPPEQIKELVRFIRVEFHGRPAASVGGSTNSAAGASTRASAP